MKITKPSLKAQKGRWQIVGISCRSCLTQGRDAACLLRGLVDIQGQRRRPGGVCQGRTTLGGRVRYQDVRRTKLAEAITSMDRVQTQGEGSGSYGR